MKSSAGPLCRLVEPGDSYLLSTWSYPFGINFFNDFTNTGEFQQWWIICERRHPFLNHMVDAVVTNIERYTKEKYPPGKSGVVELAGGGAYTNGIKRLIKEGETKYRVVCPNGNDVLQYRTKWKLWEQIFPTRDKSHYSKQKAEIIKKI